MMKDLPNYFFYWLVWCSVMVMSACQSLPSLEGRESSVYISSQNQHVSQALHLFPEKINEQSKVETQSLTSQDTQIIENNGMSKRQELRYPAQLYILTDAKDALAARVVLIDNATVSIDAQYYIWRNDISGSLLMQKLWQAANRGVRIRLLLDDNNTRGMDHLLAALNSHPNIQIRLFNPFIYRSWRALGYLTDFPRLNRRMHNKSFIVDNQAVILGGRNIGDEYFDIDVDTAFADVDVLVGGKVVVPISEDFDRYWNSDSAYPLDRVIKKANLQKGLQQLYASHLLEQTYWVYQNHLQHSAFSQALREGTLAYVHAETRLISDDPAKALDRRVEVNITEELNHALQNPQREMYLVSPYFVPTKFGTSALVALAQQGIKITILTNSLRATDVAAVHSGYARYRRPLLKAGIQLYEFKADNAVLTNKDRGLTGSSASSLHAKTFVVDEERVFIGSFNLDPRSARLNTEMGLVIYHPALAKVIQSSLYRFTTQTAYHLTLDKQNRLQWTNPDTQETSYQEPEAGFWKRVVSRILSYLPIERLL